MLLTTCSTPRAHHAATQGGADYRLLPAYQHQTECAGKGYEMKLLCLCGMCLAVRLHFENQCPQAPASMHLCQCIRLRACPRVHTRAVQGLEEGDSTVGGAAVLGGRQRYRWLLLLPLAIPGVVVLDICMLFTSLLPLMFPRVRRGRVHARVCVWRAGEEGAGHKAVCFRAGVCGIRRRPVGMGILEWDQELAIRWSETRTSYLKPRLCLCCRDTGVRLLAL